MVMSNKRKVVTLGDVFNSLTLIEKLANKDSAGHYLGKFLCACGVEKLIRLTRVTAGVTKSCGCLGPRLLRAMTTTHGLSKTREFHIWQNMKYRCEKVGSKDYAHYGGKGISVDPRWSNFETFWADMGRAPSTEHTLDRINGRLNYSPDNCRWATHEEQMNNRSCSVKYLYEGENLSRPQIARRVGMKTVTLVHRLRAGMTLEAAIAIPVRRQGDSRPLQYGEAYVRSHKG